MSFNIVDGHKTLINARAVSANQMKLVGELIDLYGGETVITRGQLKAGHLTLRGKLASPYFIAKNVAAQVKGQRGKYNLSVFKLAASAKNVTVEVVEAPAPKTKGRKEIAKPRKELSMSKDAVRKREAAAKKKLAASEAVAA